MKKSKRLSLVCGELKECGSFADVGCDHGYCTQYMLDHGLCGRAVISDISRASLKKAETLLEKHIQEGRVTSVCCFGLEKIPRDVEQVLIAGMGGEEIIKILKEGFLPEKLVLQPMKNTPQVREFLLKSGYAIVRDFTFFDEKFYDLLRAEKPRFANDEKGIIGTVCRAERRNKEPERKYDARSLLFGYDNIHSPGADFLKKLDVEIEKCETRLKIATAEKLQEQLNVLKEVQNEIERNLYKN